MLPVSGTLGYYAGENDKATVTIEAIFSGVHPACLTQRHTHTHGFVQCFRPDAAQYVQ